MMKKGISLILCVWLCLLTMQTVYGFEEEPLEKINHLNLSHLEYMSDMPGYARTTEPILLKANTTYTLVMSEAFLGQYWNFPEMMEIEVEDNDGTPVYAERPILDMTHQRAYMTFDTGEGFMNILKMPVNDQLNYEVILYEGVYADFPGFIPFVEDSEPLEYHGVLPIDYDQQPSLDVIKSYVTAKNPQGSVITSTLIYDEYSTSSKLPGTYHLVFETVYHAIKKRYHLDIRIFDLTPPELTIEQGVDIPVDQKWSIDELKDLVMIQDNVDTLNSMNLYVVSDTYSEATTIGSYHVTFGIKDIAGNEGTVMIPIELIDRTGPVVKGPSSIYLYTTDTPITNAAIQQKLQATDAVDGSNITITIPVNEYNQTTMPGRYKVHFSVKDTQQNETIFIVYVHVIDNRGPSFEQSELILLKTTADQMSEDDIVDWLRDQLNLSGYHVQNLQILYNEYASNQNEKGSYYVYFTYDIEGESYTSRVRIDVKKKELPWLIIGSSLAGVIFITGGLWIYLKRKRHNP